MDNTSAMHIFQRQTYLYEPIEYFRFWEWLIIFDLALNMVSHISYFTIFHDNDELFQSEIALFIGNNVWMIEVLE